MVCSGMPRLRKPSLTSAGKDMPGLLKPTHASQRVQPFSNFFARLTGTLSVPIVLMTPLRMPTQSASLSARLRSGGFTLLQRFALQSR